MRRHPSASGPPTDDSERAEGDRASDSDLARRAALLSIATVVWNLIVGGAAVVTAATTGSLALIGFGINAVVDSSVSTLLVWRFRVHTSSEAARIERLERTALHLAAAAFTVIALYLSVQGVRALLNNSHPDNSTFGIVEAVAALAVLPYIAVGKYRLSIKLGSRALRADSILTMSGIALAAIALAGLIVQEVTDWPKADPLAALVIAALLARQARNAYRS